jgi:aspartyl-tRNA(Asn)/glutamyl-tRNA(Gln) amidotransferase subunit A
MDLVSLRITEARALLRKGEVTPEDIARRVIAVIESRDPEIRAYLDVYADELLRKARELTRSGAYRDLPLGGIPVAVKDNICISEKRVTCGSRILEHYQSPYTATAVQKLERAGALVVGKTNCDEFAMGSSNENSAFGPVKNPWDLSRVPGGSSGGSAAAVAAGMAYAALGSDTGGSIRQPASLCGVVGVKPTYGRVSRYGLVAFASSFDQIGPIARSVEDAAVILNAICGEDPKDATSLSAPVPDFTEGLERGLEGVTVGVPTKFLSDEVGEAVRENFDRVLAELPAAGARVREVELPHAEYAVAVYYIVANAEASANLARYDGVRYGHRTSEAADLYDMYTHTRGEGFGREVKRRILLGTYVLSAGYYDAHYMQAQKVRSLIVGDFEKAFCECDLIALPTAPTPAFKLGEKSDDPIMMYLCDVFTVPVNLAGLPAISVPSGLSPERLPIGIQLIAPALAEEMLLRGARAIERIVGFDERRIG